MKKKTGKERLVKYAMGGEPEEGIEPEPKDSLNLYKPKDTVKMIKLTDNRKINPATGKAFLKDHMGSKTLNASTQVLATLIAHAKAKGVDPYDALAIPYQESGFGASGTGLGEVKDYFPDQDVSDSFSTIDDRTRNEEANTIVKALKDKFDYAKRLGYAKKGDAYRLQAYNGYGKLAPQKGEKTASFYGIPVTADNPLDMTKNPAYGKTVASLKQILKSNPEVKALVNKVEPFKPYQEYANGGQVGTPGWMGLAQQAPELLSGIMSIIDNNPKAYSQQPTLNANTMRQMVTPYAMGGIGGDDNSDMNEQQMYQLQQMADQYGISVEELIQQLQDAQSDADVSMADEPDDTTADVYDPNDSDQFAYGGVKKVGSKKKFSSTLMKRAMYAMGGNTPIEVEGGEVMQTPDGAVSKVQGPSHENGGVPVNVPDGTKIYSDRLKIDGKTMQERKLGRERSLSRLQKLLDKNPTDQLTKGSLERTKQVTQAEEAQDMQLQKIMNAQYNGAGQQQEEPQFGMGGQIGKYAMGGDPYGDYMSEMLKLKNKTKVPYVPGFVPDPQETQRGLNTVPVSPINTSADIKVTGRTGADLGGINVGDTPSTDEPSTKFGFTPGDYVGMAGNLFNAIAPIVNTNNAASATNPNVNRFQGFGHNALATNDKAQDTLGTLRTSQLTDIDTAANSARMSNRNSARSVNAIRALDAVTNVNATKAKQAATDSFSKGMLDVFGKRSQLENAQDKIVMSGQQSTDLENKMDKDNYYSNMAQNLTNFGSNIQGIGKSFNINRSNQVDAKLISQLSQYGLGFDENGTLISTKPK